MIKLATLGNREFHFTDKRQIVEFNFEFRPEFVEFDSVSNKGSKLLGEKTCHTVARGKFLRNGRQFDDTTKALNFLVRYLYHNRLITFNTYREMSWANN